MALFYFNLKFITNLLLQIRKASSVSVCLDKLRRPLYPMIQKRMWSTVYDIIIASATRDVTSGCLCVSRSMNVIISVSSMRKSKSIPIRNFFMKDPHLSLNMMILFPSPLCRSAGGILSKRSHHLRSRM